METAALIISAISAIATIVMGLYLKKVSETQTTLIDNQSKVVESAERFMNMIPIETLEKIVPHADKIARTEEREKFETLMEEKVKLAKKENADELKRFSEQLTEKNNEIRKLLTQSKLGQEELSLIADSTAKKNEDLLKKLKDIQQKSAEFELESFYLTDILATIIHRIKSKKSLLSSIQEINHFYFNPENPKEKEAIELFKKSLFRTIPEFKSVYEKNNLETDDDISEQLDDFWRP